MVSSYQLATWGLHFRGLSLSVALFPWTCAAYLFGFLVDVDRISPGTLKAYGLAAVVVEESTSNIIKQHNYKHDSSAWLSLGSLALKPNKYTNHPSNGLSVCTRKHLQNDITPSQTKRKQETWSVKPRNPWPPLQYKETSEKQAEKPLVTDRDPLPKCQPPAASECLSVAKSRSEAREEMPQPCFVSRKLFLFPSIFKKAEKCSDH